MSKARKTCIDCGAAKSPNRHRLVQRCEQCLPVFQAAMLAANVAISRARATGVLVSPKALTCVDCGSSAHDYDHRDYSKPLDVQPVCRACNFKRGPAKYRVAA